MASQFDTHQDFIIELLADKGKSQAEICKALILKGCDFKRLDNGKIDTSSFSHWMKRRGMRRTQSQKDNHSGLLNATSGRTPQEFTTSIDAPILVNQQKFEADQSNVQTQTDLNRDRAKVDALKDDLISTLKDQVRSLENTIEFMKELLLRQFQPSVFTDATEQVAVVPQTSTHQYATSENSLLTPSKIEVPTSSNVYMEILKNVDIEEKEQFPAGVRSLDSFEKNPPHDISVKNIDVAQNIEMTKSDMDALVQQDDKNHADNNEVSVPYRQKPPQTSRFGNITNYKVVKGVIKK